MDSDKTSNTGLPSEAIEYINAVIKKMRYRRKVRADVRAELTAHFEDALRDCDSDNERTKLAADLIAKFGEPKILAKLIRRGKKRCRPLWQQVIAQAAGIIAVVFLLYTAWFVTGKPVIETDYLALLNQKHRDIKTGLSDDNNALYDYEKAEQLFVEPDEEVSSLIVDQRGDIDREMTDPEKEIVRRWLKKNEPAWQHLVAGTRKPYCYFELEYEDENVKKQLGHTAFPIHQFWRHLRDIGSWRMKIALEQGQVQEALVNCLTMVRIAPQFAENSYWIVEHMMACLSTTEILNHILYIVDTNELSAVELKTLQEQLTRLFPDGYPLFILPMEESHMIGLDFNQHIFTSGGPGGGHIIPGYLEELNMKSWSGILKITGSILQSMMLARRDDMKAMISEIHDRAIKDIQMSPYQFKLNGSSAQRYVEDLSKYKRYKILTAHAPIMRGRAEYVFQVKAYYEAVIMILALERWKLDKGQYPDSLDELVEGKYITAIAMDPYSDGPLIYKIIDDGFTLYSVGPDFKDDSGQQGKDSNGDVSYIGKWEIKDGDTVFWPVWRDEN